MLQDRAVTILKLINQKQLPYPELQLLSCLFTEHLEAVPHETSEPRCTWKVGASETQGPVST